MVFCCPNRADVLSFVFVFGLLASMGKLVFWAPWMLDSHMPHASSNVHFNVSLPVDNLHTHLRLNTDFLYIPSWFAAKTFNLGVTIQVAKPCSNTGGRGGGGGDDAMLSHYLRTCHPKVQLKCVDIQDEPVAYIHLGELMRRQEFYFRTDYPTPRPNPSHRQLDATRPRCSLELVLTQTRCNISASELGTVFVYWHADAVPNWVASDWIPRTLYNMFTLGS